MFFISILPHPFAPRLSLWWCAGEPKAFKILTAFSKGQWTSVGCFPFNAIRLTQGKFHFMPLSLALMVFCSLVVTNLSNLLYYLVEITFRHTCAYFTLKKIFCSNYSWPSNNVDLNVTGPLIWGFFQYIGNSFWRFTIIWKKIFFYFIVKIHYICSTYREYVITDYLCYW